MRRRGREIAIEIVLAWEGNQEGGGVCFPRKEWKSRSFSDAKGRKGEYPSSVKGVDWAS